VSCGARDANRVVILDTAMRDGEPSPGCSMNLEVKAVR
jgi:isopropylmalate/homocitrate/citramalate synthase